MRALIVSDVHSNLEALTGVIKDAELQGTVDEVWSLGDLVGYGPDPGPVIDLVRETVHRAVVGNHDLAAAGKLSLEDFNPFAAEANRWTSGVLDDSQRRYVGDQPLRAEVDEFTLVHGSPRDPVWEYVISARSAVVNFNHFDTFRCLVGHSHVPFICRPDPEIGAAFMSPSYGHPFVLGERRLIVNPGSVGQPRDGDPRAAYAVYDSDSETITHYRVEYDIAATQDKMRAHGLPEFLIERLEYGQ